MYLLTNEIFFFFLPGKILYIAQLVSATYSALYDVQVCHSTEVFMGYCDN